MFGNEFQLAQMMGITTGMPALITRVGRPMIMHQHADERLQQAEGIQRLGTAFGMGKVGRQLCGAQDMPPVQLATDAHTGLVGGDILKIKPEKPFYFDANGARLF